MVTRAAHTRFAGIISKRLWFSASSPASLPFPASSRNGSSLSSGCRQDGGSDLPKKNRRAAVRLGIAAVVIALAVSGVVFVWANADARENLVQCAQTAAAVIDRNAVSRLSDLLVANNVPAVLQSPDFPLVKQQLRAVRDANPDCRFVYLLSESQGRGVYLVDAEDEASQAYSAPGDDFGEVPPDAEESLRAGHAIVGGPAIDKWGMWISAMVPVFDGNGGRVVAVLGMDVAAQAWPAKFLPYVMATGAGSLMLIGLLASSIKLRRKDVEDELRHFASHDFLTGVPNRYALEVFLNAVNLPGQEQKTTVGVLDIDNFKVINDSFTHAVGDKALLRLVKVIRDNLRQEDFVARLGGDEFALVFPGMPLDEAKEAAIALREAVQASPFAVGEQSLDLTISVGLAEIDPAYGAEVTLSRADMALYAAKRAGRNKVLCYSRSLPAQAQQVDAQRMLPLVKSAIASDRLVIHLQPIVESDTGDVKCYEILSRIRDDDGSLIYPGAFLPVAEQHGLVASLDRKVVAAAVSLLVERHNLRLFVNLSQSSVGDPDALDFIRQTVADAGIEPARLGFEISEAVASTDLDSIGEWIGKLKVLGCPIALDDFGAGYSSFLRLGTLPVDYLKIDGAFVRDMDTEATHKAFVQAMNDMAHAVGKKTVAEFVESDAIRSMIKEMGVDLGQGYHYGRPAPVEDWKSTWRHPRAKVKS